MLVIPFPSSHLVSGMRICIAALTLFYFYFQVCSFAFSKGEVFESVHYDVTVDVVAGNLDHPWGLGFLPDGSLLVTERSGKLKLLLSSGEQRLVSGVPKVWHRGQGGLLDVAIDPHFSENQTIYVSYSEPSDDEVTGGTAIASGQLDFSYNPRLRNVQVIFSENKKTDSGYHFGSRIVIAPDRSLYLTIGDRGDGKRAQDPFDYAGSIIRIKLDGSVPRDNPYSDGIKGFPEIWSIGHRNPQGAFWNPSTNTLWTVSHGARGGDEINRLEPGRNYGWPVVSYGRHYSGKKIGEGTHKAGLEQPVHYWDPSIAPSGVAYYGGDVFSAWKGHIFVGALKFELISRLKLEDDKVIYEERLFEGRFGRIRDIREGPDGYLYFLTDESPGQLLRIRPKH